MAEKYRCRGRATKYRLYPGSQWEEFYAYSDSDAETQFYHLTGLSKHHGDAVETQMWDEDFRFWVDID